MSKMIEDTATLEAKAVRFLQAGEEIRKLEEERLTIKADVAHLMEVAQQDEYRFPLNELFDVKVKVSERKSNVIDKQELANDLGVAESAINLDFLLKAVEEGKLTYQRFKQYCHQEFNESVSIRQINAD